MTAPRLSEVTQTQESVLKDSVLKEITISDELTREKLTKELKRLALQLSATDKSINQTNNQLDQTGLIDWLIGNPSALQQALKADSKLRYFILTRQDDVAAILNNPNGIDPAALQRLTQTSQSGRGYVRDSELAADAFGSAAQRADRIKIVTEAVSDVAQAAATVAATAAAGPVLGAVAGAVLGGFQIAAGTEAEIAEGRVSRSEAWKQALEKMLSEAISSLQIAAGVKVGSLVGARVSSDGLLGGILGGAAGAEASGLLSLPVQLHDFINRRAQAGEEFDKQNTGVVLSPNERSAQREKYLEEKGLSTKTFIGNMLIDIVGTAIAGAFGGAGGELKQVNEGLVKQALIKLTEAAGDLIIGLGSAKLKAAGEVGFEEVVRQVASSTIGTMIGEGATSARTGYVPDEPNMMTRKELPDWNISNADSAHRYAKAGQNKESLVRTKYEVELLSTEEIKRADEYTQKVLKKLGIPLVPVNDITQFDKGRLRAHLDPSQEFTGRLYDLNEKSFGKIKTNIDDPLAPAVLHPDMPKLVKAAREAGCKVVIDSSLTSASTLGVYDPVAGKAPTLYLRLDTPFSVVKHEFSHMLVRTGIAEHFGGERRVSDDGKVTWKPGSDGYKKVELLAARNTPAHMDLLDKHSPLLANAIRYRRMGLDEIAIDESLAVDSEMASLRDKNYSPDSFAYIAAENYKLGYQLDSFERAEKKWPLSPEQKALKEDLEARKIELGRVMSYCEKKLEINENDFLLDLTEAQLKQRLELVKKPIRREALGLPEVDPFEGMNADQIRVEKAVREVSNLEWSSSNLPARIDGINPLKNNHVRLLYRLPQDEATLALEHGLTPYDLSRKLNANISDPLRSTTAARQAFDSIQKSKKDGETVLVIDIPESLFREYTSPQGRYDEVDRRFIVGAIAP